MTSSASCSSRARRVALLLAALCGAVSARAPAQGVRRVEAIPQTARARGSIALFPLANLSGAVAPVQELAAALEKALRDRGLPTVAGAALEPFLSEHRVRYTGGLASDTAAQARDELGVTAVLIATLTAFQEAPPRLGVELRLVSAKDDPEVLWAGGASRAGDESPGLFELGIVSDLKKLEQQVFGELAASLLAFQQGRGPRALSCPAPGRFRPRVAFRAPSLDPAGTLTVAVLPFVNGTSRRGAGEVVPLLFLRQLLASGRFRVVEPGAIRDELLRFRLVMEGGVTLDHARVMMELLRADLVLAGTVRAYRDPTIGSAAPEVQFGATLLDRKNNEVVWDSASENQGDDGVFFFDAGKVGTAGDLACRMARGVVEEVLEKRQPAKTRRLSP